VTGGGFWTGFKLWIVSFVVGCLFRLLRATWRLEEDPLPAAAVASLESGQALVCAHWHEDEWALLGFYADRQMIVMVSRSEDGSAMSRFLRRLGFEVVRGSSSKGAVQGLLGLIRTVRRAKAKTVSLAVDGPRGPRRRPKKGVFKLAETLNANILPGAAYADRAWVFHKAWSKAYVPKPFARVRLVYGAPFALEYVKTGIERDDYATLSYDLESRLRDAKSVAQKNLGV
jgi:lysophospholipid acyltransferase (LPLAT)-like uncharacterized protein